MVLGRVKGRKNCHVCSHYWLFIFLNVIAVFLKVLFERFCTIFSNNAIMIAYFCLSSEIKGKKKFKDFFYIIAKPKLFGRVKQ